MITWTYDGKEVAVEGSWDNCKTRKSLQRSGKDFIILKVLPSDVYQYRFVVDGQWRYSPDVSWTKDEAGNNYNILELQDYEERVRGGTVDVDFQFESAVNVMTFVYLSRFFYYANLTYLPNRFF
ncbi:hypothetical protein R6Q59_009123 [Mikania micrantha]